MKCRLDLNSTLCDSLENIDCRLCKRWDKLYFMCMFFSAASSSKKMRTIPFRLEGALLWPHQLFWFWPLTVFHSYQYIISLHNDLFLFPQSIHSRNETQAHSLSLFLLHGDVNILSSEVFFWTKRKKKLYSLFVFKQTHVEWRRASKLFFADPYFISQLSRKSFWLLMFGGNLHFWLLNK